MNLTSIQAAVVAAITQVVSLIVGFGIVNSVVAGSLISATTALVNVGFLVAHSLHAQAGATVQAAKVATPVQINAPTAVVKAPGSAAPLAVSGGAAKKPKAKS